MTEILAGTEIQLTSAAQHLYPSSAPALGHSMMTEPGHENQVWRGGSLGSKKCWPVCRGYDYPFWGALALRLHVRNLHTELSVCFYSKWWGGWRGRSLGSCIQGARLALIFCLGVVFSSGMTNLWWSIHKVCCCNCFADAEVNMCKFYTFSVPLLLLLLSGQSELTFSSSRARLCLAPLVWMLFAISSMLFAISSISMLLLISCLQQCGAG